MAFPTGTIRTRDFFRYAAAYGNPVDYAVTAGRGAPKGDAAILPSVYIVERLQSKADFWWSFVVFPQE